MRRVPPLPDGAGATTTFPQPAGAAYGTAAGSADAGEADAAPVTFTTFYGAADPPATYGYLGGTTSEKGGGGGASCLFTHDKHLFRSRLKAA